MMRQFKKSVFQIVIFIIAGVIMLLAFVPIFTMLLLSIKSNAQIYGDFFALPWPVMWGNYSKAVDRLIPNMVNTLVVVTASTALTVAICAVNGYVFARLRFPGRNILYFIVIAMMMVPGILLLTPQYALVQRYGIYNTWWALLLPWVSTGQIFSTMLCRTSMSSLPGEIFESARIDGCSEIKAMTRIALPLSKPILATVVIMKMVDYYNDFLWPLLAIESNSKQVVTVMVRMFESNRGADIGSLIAGFVFTTIPLFILFMFTSRLYIEGLTSGAVKG